MICVSLAERGIGALLAALRDIDFAEVRLDKTELSPSEVRTLFGLPKRLIATCRPGTLSQEERKALLLEAVASGAAYVDVELEADEAYRAEILARARTAGCAVLVSHHDDEKTPQREALDRIVARCFDAGADVAKIACRVNDPRDCARLLGLLDSNRPIVAVGMGPLGRITRLAAPLLGSPFTFASLAKGRETAEGQISSRRLRSLLASLGEGS